MEEVYISGVKWYKIGENAHFLSTLQMPEKTDFPQEKTINKSVTKSNAPARVEKKWNVVKKK